jgi:GAF domain-containing protein
MPDGANLQARPTLQAVCETTREFTTASTAWLMEADGADLVIVAASCTDPAFAATLMGRRFSLTDGGTASMVMQSGQPVALQPGSASATSDAIATAVLGRQAASLVCVPCADDERVLGVLQLVDRADGGPFGFDDLELLSMLGAVAGASLLESGGGLLDVPPPATLAHELTRLAEADPNRYAAMARVIEVMLGQ